MIIGLGWMKEKPTKICPKSDNSFMEFQDIMGLACEVFDAALSVVIFCGLGNCSYLLSPLFYPPLCSQHNLTCHNNNKQQLL